jgi:hypothetical protein
VNDQQRRLRPSFIHGRPTFCLWISCTLKNNIAILYERNELSVNENSYGVIKSLMESPIWVDLIAATLKYESGQDVHVRENIRSFEEDRAISGKLMT